MSEVEKTRKQLKIKAGVAKRCDAPLARRRTGTSEAEPNAQRLMKEVGMYRKEVEQNQIRLEKLRADGAEEWDVKNAVRLSPSFLPFA